MPLCPTLQFLKLKSRRTFRAIPVKYRKLQHYCFPLATPYTSNPKKKEASTEVAQRGSWWRSLTHASPQVWRARLGNKRVGAGDRESSAPLPGMRQASSHGLGKPRGRRLPRRGGAAEAQFLHSFLLQQQPPAPSRSMGSPRAPRGPGGCGGGRGGAVARTRAAEAPPSARRAGARENLSRGAGSRASSCEGCAALPEFSFRRCLRTRRRAKGLAEGRRSRGPRGPCR